MVQSTSNSSPDKEDQGWRTIPSSKGITFGLQYHTSTVLVDVHEEKVLLHYFLTHFLLSFSNYLLQQVYIFTTRPLDGSFSTDALQKGFPLRAMPLRDFFSCRAKVKTPPPEVPLVWTARILFLVLTILGVGCLCAVSLYAFCRQGSTIKGEEVKEGERNVRYRYLPLGGSSNISNNFGTRKMGRKRRIKMAATKSSLLLKSTPESSKITTTTAKEVSSVYSLPGASSTVTSPTTKTSSKKISRKILSKNITKTKKKLKS